MRCSLSLCVSPNQLTQAQKTARKRNTYVNKKIGKTHYKFDGEIVRKVGDQYWASCEVVGSLPADRVGIKLPKDEDDNNDKDGEDDDEEQGGEAMDIDKGNGVEKGEEQREGEDEWTQDDIVCCEECGVPIDDSTMESIGCCGCKGRICASCAPCTVSEALERSDIFCFYCKSSLGEPGKGKRKKKEKAQALKFSLLAWHRDVVIPKFEEIARDHGGAQIRYQMDGAGPHRCKWFQAFMRREFQSRSWEFVMQPAQSPTCNVLDLCVFPSLSRAASRGALIRRDGTSARVLRGDEIFDVAELAFKKMKESTVARSFMLAHEVVKKIIASEGDNAYITNLHLNVRHNYIATKGGVVRVPAKEDVVDCDDED